MDAASHVSQQSGQSGSSGSGEFAVPSPLGVNVSREEHLQQVEALTADAKVLDELVTFLHGRCVACWMMLDQLRPNTHFAFSECTRGFVHCGKGIREWGKLIVLPQYKYCYRCGLPQKDRRWGDNDYMPTVHNRFVPGTLSQCNCEDFVVHVLWALLHKTEEWQRVCIQFPGCQDLGRSELATWFQKEETPLRFYRGLEVVIWWYKDYRSHN